LLILTRVPVAWTTLRCELLILPFAAANAVLILSLTAIGLERYWEVRRVRSVESSENFARVAIAACWGLGVATVVTLMFTSQDWDAPVAHCVTILFRRQNAAITLGAAAMYLTNEIGALVGFLGLLAYTKRHLVEYGINTATHNLVYRLHLHNTLKITRMLLPSVILHAVAMLPCISAAIMGPIMGLQNVSTSSALFVNVSLLVPVCSGVFSFGHALICLAVDGPVKNAFKKDCPRLCAVFKKKTEVKWQPAMVDYRVSPDKSRNVIEDHWNQMKPPRRK
jgi:hypothetical protein